MKDRIVIAHMTAMAFVPLSIPFGSPPADDGGGSLNSDEGHAWFSLLVSSR